MLHNNENMDPEEGFEQATFLSKIKKENHFSTPKRYFESLPEVINNKKLENKSLAIHFDKLSYRHLTAYLAVCVILFTVIFNIENTQIESELTPEQISEVIINDTYISMDEEMIYETYYEMEEGEIDNTSPTNSDELIEYLIDNDINVSSIIEEL